jgi:hypothetical protein
MNPNPDIFHAHLDECAQCREHPFDLCSAGAVLLRVAAEGLPPTGRLNTREPRLQNIPIRTELGKEIRSAFTGPPGSVMMGTDFSALEMRIAAAFNTKEGTFVCAECGCETNTSMEKPCVACGSVKVVLLSMVETLFGKNWRDCFRDPK